MVKEKTTKVQGAPRVNLQRGVPKFSGQLVLAAILSILAPGAIAALQRLGTDSITVGSAAGSSSVVLSTVGSWNATANDSFLHISPGSVSGTDSVLVVFTIDAFAGTGTRNGTLTIAGMNLAVTQVGSNWTAVYPAPTTLAPGLNLPEGVAVDNSGNVYIAAWGSATSIIYKWSATTEQLTTLVSSGLNDPSGVAVDGAGNVYIADTYNQAIKKWSAATQQVTTLVSSGLSYPWGVAVDAAGNLYIGDSGHNAVKKWDVATQQVTTLVSSGLSNPRGVAVDGAGNVYIADTNHNAIKVWSPLSQTVSTLVSSGLNGPYGVALDASGNVYIADTTNHAVEKWTVTTQQLTTLASSAAGLIYPYGVAVDGSGNVYIAADSSVKKISVGFETLGTTSLTVGSAAGSNSVEVGFLPVNTTAAWTAATTDSWLHVTTGSGAGGATIQFTFDANPGTTVRTGTIALDSGLVLAVTQVGANYSAVNPVTTLVSSGLALPSGVAVDASGNVYIADMSNNAVKQWTAATQQVTWLVSSGLTAPFGVSVDNSGNVYIGDMTNLAVYKWIAAAQALTTLAAFGLDEGPGVAVDASGNVYIASYDKSAIDVWGAPAQQVTALVSSGLNGPYGVAVDVAGNVYFSDTFNNALKKWSAATGTVSTLVSLGLHQPIGVAVDGSGNVYIADIMNNAVKEWNAATQQVTTLVSGLNGPRGVAVDGSGNVYIADTWNSAIKEIPASFVAPISLTESGSAGTDSLPPVLPATTSLAGVFAPASDQSWLTIGSISNGVVSFSFTANASGASRVAHITVLGQQMTVTQNSQPTQATQTIAFGTLSNRVFGTAPFTVAASATSGLAVSFNSQTQAFCTISGTTVTLLSVGTCTLQATQSGDANYLPAAAVNQSFLVTAASSAAPLRFVPITPCRIVDTRNAAGPFGGPSITGGTSRDFTVPSSACSIPSTAQAYSLNVAVVPVTTLGYLTLYPAGQSRPLASTLNSLDGRIKSNAAIVPAGTNGAVSVFASDTTQVILDINGYFVPATDPTGLAFYPITPCRIADTRTATAPLGGPALVGGQNRTFPILASTCNLPATAQAYSLNFAAVPSGSLGYLTAWPTAQTRPLAASLNALTGAITANAAIVPAGANGSIDVFASNTTNLVIDINGYFAPMGTGGLSLYGVTPCRVLDTRQPAGSPPITTLDVAVSASACGIPANAQAHVMSVTVVPQGTPPYLGYLTLWPQGQTRPVVSTLNALDGAITSNMAIVPATNGSISAFASNPTHLILDISGYFGQ